MEQRQMITPIDPSNLAVNRPINLSVGTSRHETKWKNRTMDWADFLTRLQQPTVTQETIAEYAKMSRAKRGEVKDVGGYVGGFLKEGRRKSGHVQNRSIITLDADSGHTELWDDMQMLSTYAMAMYTTHSHTAAKPKYRFIIPLSRPVTVDEYEPISRKIANMFGMDNFDDSTYQPERLMYWPSHARDAEFVFDYIDDSWLEPDSILDQYPDWRDSSYWPESSRADVKRKRTADKQGDPLEKSGVIGAFCKTYDIESAIETFLVGIYEPTNHPERYTYLDGSTSGGLVIYDSKFAYSHHGTDPVGEQLVNAYDLVRIHKFGHLDEDVTPQTNIAKYPSFSAMQAFALDIKEVTGLMARERIAQASDDFDDDLTESEDWLNELEVNKSGVIEASAANLELILMNDPHLKDTMYLDEFAKRFTLRRALPWRKVDEERFWKDADDSGLRIYLEKTYGIVSRSKIDDALLQEIERNSFHPVRAYLDQLEWDGVPRLETLLVDYLGAEDTLYTRTVTRKFLTAAVARIYVPGIKFDYMIVTTGPQGIGKTLLPNKLAGEWFSNSLEGVQGKDAYDALQGCWIMEMGEMTATKKADLEATKHFISKQEDIFRVAYGRHKSYFKRQCVFWGTSNDGEFLRDKTGNRRFWPVDVGVNPHDKKVWDLQQDEVDQIWAEAKHCWNQGEKLYLTDAENALAVEQQQLHTEVSGMEGEIADFLEIPITEDWYDRSKQERREYIQGYHHEELQGGGELVRDRISVAEVWNELYAKDTANIHPLKAAEIRSILANMDGWEKYNKSNGQMRIGPGYGRQVVYVSKLFI